MVRIGNDWDAILCEEFNKEYYLKLREFLVSEYRLKRVYPQMDDIFNAFKYCSYENTGVVILGQDPYHKKGQAHGLCFSVKKGVDIPPSLKNIYKELERDLGVRQPGHGCLIEWAKEGVLLLNATLTVREGEPLSHKGHGWEEFTNSVIATLNERQKPMVFILWGANAWKKEEMITNPNHLILKGAHPSPLSASRGFFGGSYFSIANRFLEQTGSKPICWQLSE